MSLHDGIVGVRAHIARYFYRDSGEPAARSLLDEASTMLLLADQAITYWQHRAEAAEALRTQEMDDGK